MPLTPHGRRDAEIEQAVHESNVRHMIELVGSYGLAGDRISLAQELRQRARAVTTRDEHQEVRGIADVWRERLRAD
jgi:hypothetical protein